MGGRNRLFFLMLFILMTTCVSVTQDCDAYCSVGNLQNKNISSENSSRREIEPNYEKIPQAIGKIPCFNHVDFMEIISNLHAFSKSLRMAQTKLMRSLYIFEPLQAEFRKAVIDVNLFCFFAFSIYLAMSTLRQIKFTYEEEEHDNVNSLSKVCNGIEGIDLAIRSLIKVDTNLLSRSRLNEITSSDLNEVIKAPTKPRWKKSEADHWMSDPLRWRHNFTKYFVSPAFGQDLLASFRGFYERMLPNNISAVLLAEAGFKFIGGDKVQCDDCKNIVNIESFTSSPTEARYHSQSCNKAVAANDDRNKSTYASCNSELDDNFGDSEQIETDSCMPAAEHTAWEEFPVKRDCENNTVEGMQYEENMKEPPDIITPLDTTPVSITNGHLLHVPETCSTHATSKLGETCQTTGSTNGWKSARRDSASTDSSGYSTASARSQFSAPSTSSNASASFSSEPDITDEGFVDGETWQMETKLDSSSHEQVPPILTIQCEKNKGHFAYFPIRQLELKHIPSCVRFPQVIEFLKLAAMLTVRVIVNGTSTNRPEKDPARNSQNIQGTGSCFERQAETSDKGTESEHPGKWNPMKKLFTGMKHKSGRIYVETSRHVIFDDYEAKNTDVEFFYNHPDRKEIKIVKGVSIEHSGTLGDYKSVLICKTSDLGLVELVNQTRQKMMDLLGKFSPDIKDGLLRRIFVIGHPHGGEKVLSYGDSVEIKYNLTSQEENGRMVHGMKKISNQQQVTNFGDQARKVLLYTADTCRGSSGSPILTFKTINPSESEVTGAGAVGDQSLQMELWMHNGIDIKHGLGGSLMKELTAEDIANHGQPSGTRAYAQDNMSRNNGGDGQSSFTQIPSCPVFTVVGHPSYPAYVAYQSRLDSYNEWRHHHIHLPVHLAEAGFFYAGYADCVRCFQCGIGLRTWKEGDDVYVEHYKSRPNCQFLQMQLRVRGISDPETQLIPQATEVSSSSGSEGSRPSGSELPKIAMMVQQTTSTSTDQTARKTHYARESEEAGLSCAGQTVTSFAMPRIQEVVVGFVTDSPTLKETTSSSESQIRNNPGAASCSGAANGNKNVTYTVLERENQLLTKQLTCKVCFMKPIQDLFLPCGELYACTDCSKLLTHCPSCKKQILATVTTYFT